MASQGRGRGAAQSRSVVAQVQGASGRSRSRNPYYGNYAGYYGTPVLGGAPAAGVGPMVASMPSNTYYSP